MRKYLIPFFFILFLASAIPTYAYIPTISNTTITGLYPVGGGFVCSPHTDGFDYCYFGGYDSVNKLSKLNLSDNSYSTCNIIDSGTNIRGVSYVSETVIAVSLAGSYDNYCYYYDITNISTGSCSVVGASNNQSESCGYYSGTPRSQNLNGFTIDNKMYFPNNNIVYDVTNLSATDQTDSNLWVATGYRILVPNASANSTYYIQDTNQDLNKYVNDVFSKQIDSVGNLFGVSDIFSIIQENASTIFGYSWDYRGSGNAFLVSFNFSLSEEQSNSPTIRAIAPINGATAITNPPTLHAKITPYINGTVYWYIDGNLETDTNTVINSSSESSLYHASATALSTGSHNWSASFKDINNNYWNTTTQDFYVGEVNFWVQPMDYFAQMTGAFFGTQDLNTSKQISAIFFSFIFSIVLPLALAIKGVRLHGDSMTFMFVIVFMGFITMFSLLGWFPLWILIIFIIIAGLGFVKIGGIGG